MDLDLDAVQDRFFQGRETQEEAKERPDDLCNLSELSEHTLLEKLQRRFAEGIIYTYVGTILVSVNPFRYLPIYNPKFGDLYRGRQVEDPLLRPHVFAIADDSFRSMVKNRKSQCIVISGESGSGKTEATKLLLHHVMQVSAKVPTSEELRRILGTAPVLEAFGNAKTVSNNNSSRFGKYVLLNFKANGSYNGASIEKYLLEKSRVIQQSQLERNYHIFYLLLAGADKKLRTRFFLNGDATKYQILSGTEDPSSKCYTVNEVDDAKEFEALNENMRVFFTSNQIQQVFQLIATLLNLGNIGFADDETGEGSVVNTNDSLRVVSNLLRVHRETLGVALVTKKTVIRGQEFACLFNRQEAEDNKWAMGKCLYEALFDWIVTKLNIKLSCNAQRKSQNTLSIGILDIFGFEDFQRNSFEQFCINFANEQLQQYFIRHIFQLEQMEYEREGISWSSVQYVDNQACLELLTKRPTGLFHLLDEESRLSQGNDKSLFEKCSHTHNKQHTCFEIPPQRGVFVIKHYAGHVTYHIDGFRDKNRDLMRQGIIHVLQNSRTPFIRELIFKESSALRRWRKAYDVITSIHYWQLISSPEDSEQSSVFLPLADDTLQVSNLKKKKSWNKAKSRNLVLPRPKTSTSSTSGDKETAKKSNKSPTVGGQFMSSLGYLMESLSQASPYFVRCIKSNQQQQPLVFDEKKIISQLRYCGMLETVRIRQLGYNIRMPIEEFLDNFGILVSSSAIGNQMQLVQSVLEDRGIAIEHAQVGSTKVFMKSFVERNLQNAVHARLTFVAVVIQRAYRRYRSMPRSERQASVASDEFPATPEPDDVPVPAPKSKPPVPVPMPKKKKLPELPVKQRRSPSLSHEESVQNDEPLANDEETTPASTPASTPSLPEVAPSPPPEVAPSPPPEVAPSPPPEVAPSPPPEDVPPPPPESVPESPEEKTELEKETTPAEEKKPIVEEKKPVEAEQQQLPEEKKPEKVKVPPDCFHKLGPAAKKSLLCGYCGKQLGSAFKKGFACSACNINYHMECLQFDGICKKSEHSPLNRVVISSLGDCDRFTTCLVTRLARLKSLKKLSRDDRLFRDTLKEYHSGFILQFSVGVKAKASDWTKFQLTRRLLEANFEILMTALLPNHSKANVVVCRKTFVHLLDEYETMGSNSPCSSSSQLDITPLSGKSKDSKSKDKKEDKGIEHNRHRFLLENFTVPTNCEHCKKTLMALEDGAVCQACKTTVHPACIKKIKSDCKQVGKSLEWNGDVFGSTLTQMYNVSQLHVPQVLEMVFTELESRGLFTPGLYRKGTSPAAMKKLRQMMSQSRNGSGLVLTPFDAHVMGGMVKLFLRELKEPIIPEHMYKSFVESANAPTGERRKLIMELIPSLPSANQFFLERLCFHLARVAQNEPANNMNANNLAIIFAPIVIVPPRSMGAMEALQQVSMQSTVMEILIETSLTRLVTAVNEITEIETEKAFIQQTIDAHMKSDGRSKSVTSEPQLPEIKTPAERAMPDEATKGKPLPPQKLPKGPQLNLAALGAGGDSDVIKNLQKKMAALDLQKKSLTSNVQSMDVDDGVDDLKPTTLKTGFQVTTSSKAKAKPKSAPKTPAKFGKSGKNALPTLAPEEDEDGPPPALTHVTKGRPRPAGGRRPPTRAHRQNVAAAAEAES